MTKCGLGFCRSNCGTTISIDNVCRRYGSGDWALASPCFLHLPHNCNVWWCVSFIVCLLVVWSASLSLWVASTTSWQKLRIQIVKMVCWNWSLLGCLRWWVWHKIWECMRGYNSLIVFCEFYGFILCNFLSFWQEGGGWVGWNWQDQEAWSCGEGAFTTLLAHPIAALALCCRSW